MKKYIMTLIVVAIAGIIVLEVEYNFFKDSPSETSSDSHESIQVNETLTNKPSSVDRSMPQHEEEVDVSESLKNNSLEEKLRKMYDMAKSISNDSYARNNALREVVDLAVNSDDYDFAMEVAREITFDTYAKNDALEMIIIHACDNEEFEVANEVADEITYNDYRKNQNKQRIMDAMKRSLK